MATEIERKFLVASDDWRDNIQYSKHYIQGYFSTNEASSIRIRVCDEQASLNIKSATLGISRSEYDYPIPIDDAMEMLQNLCKKPLMEKTRYFINYDNHTWE
ncbi:MAG TPA: CYTH domain-containing protein, partial [Gammaproteobacteria bacterium]|nr:CYTH domain-containing protein [Gammaproteobacteria bacterium]